MAVRAVISFLLLFLPANSSPDCPLKSLQNVCKGQEIHNPFCEHKVSRHCEDVHKHSLRPCHTTLHEDTEETCKISSFSKDKRCGSLQPNQTTTPEASLVDLRLYHNASWGGIINLTFPGLVNNTMEELEFQYKYIGGMYGDSCRRLYLFSPPNSTLMYECRTLNKFVNETVNIRLTVQSDSGKGASYLFRNPPGFRIDPEKTCPSDWHTFFYIHRDAIHHRSQIPVTVQSSPFGQVDYEVMLVRCVGDEDEDEDEDGESCQHYKKLGSVVERRNTSDDLWLVYLPRVEESGQYMVRVQIQADWCPPQPQGCYVSVSPKFLVTKPTPRGTGLTYLLLVIVFFIVAFIVQRRGINRKLFKHMRACQPTVLLAYHPESLPALHFVNTLADFLENTCFVRPLMADREALGQPSSTSPRQDPIQWTKTEMTNADRVIFIVPKDSEAQSVTVLRGLWMVALNHCSGHDFTASQDKKVAKILLPTSGSVPWQIVDVRRFDLSQSPTYVATWLHGGSWLDRVFMWWPHIRSSAKKKVTPTWQDVKLAASEKDSSLNLTTLEASPLLTSLEKDVSVMGQEFPSISFHKQNNDPENDGSDDDKADTGEVFDPDIPAVDKLCGSREGGGARLSSIHESLQEEEDEDVLDIMD
ncbi:uncharacterized protein LOC127003484 isoform X2 [Eriocheir sinensis]|uniref:uncharacterized protein LOC127003484 isoform X2 n=1 Tax=Eriocheir sinensis TaxID=95602 RepID=UPI0021C95B00|nr:uncharacterized protein LOC127003484 isoform X2 [Eriocheir sinensis]